MKDLIVIGGGASGLAAAITAKDLGCDVIILESTDRIGKKILTTGNGRCNISNSKIKTDRYHSENIGFPNTILSKFDLNYTENFFNTLGLPIIKLDDNKLFPMSLQASSVVDIFRMALDDKNIPLFVNTEVITISKINNTFIVECKNGETFEAKKVLLSTGGKSASKTGSKGAGYIFAKNFGHKITNLQPSLVQLKLSYPHLKSISGIKFQGSVDIFVDGVQKGKDFGEILFTDYGISGPPIFQISRLANFSLSKNSCITLEIDLMPDISNDDLSVFLENHFGVFSYRSIHDTFIGLINKKLITTFLKDCGLKNIHSIVSDLEWKEKKEILKNLKHWKFQVSGHNSMENAQVTAGGVDTGDVNNETLESKLVKGLYFSGEILDVDGDCGGFNLQWAWSSGFASGASASSK